LDIEVGDGRAGNYCTIRVRDDPADLSRRQGPNIDAGLSPDARFSAAEIVGAVYKNIMGRCGKQLGCERISAELSQCLWELRLADQRGQAALPDLRISYRQLLPRELEIIQFLIFSRLRSDRFHVAQLSLHIKKPAQPKQIARGSN
jgi:hypothetical protein